MLPIVNLLAFLVTFHDPPGFINTLVFCQPVLPTIHCTYCYLFPAGPTSPSIHHRHSLLHNMYTATLSCFTLLHPLYIHPPLYILLFFWSPSIMDYNVFLLSEGKNHVRKQFKVRRWCTIPSQLTWPSTKKSDGTDVFVTVRFVGGRSVLLEMQLVFWDLPARGHHTSVICRCSLPYGSCRRETCA